MSAVACSEQGVQCATQPFGMAGMDMLRDWQEIKAPFTGGSMEDANFYAWQPVLFATVHEVSHGTEGLALENGVLREAFELRSVEDAAAAVCREAQAPAHGREMQLAASVPQIIYRLQALLQLRGDRPWSWILLAAHGIKTLMKSPITDTTQM
jgi:hypothetical protein